MDPPNLKKKFLYSMGPFKTLYTSPPGRPVHADTNSASPGSILAMQQLHTKTIHSHFHQRLQPGTNLYSWVNWGIVERLKMRELRNSSEWDSHTLSLAYESSVLPPSLTALHDIKLMHSASSQYPLSVPSYLLSQVIYGLCKVKKNPK